eukprot:5525870-Prymnesium_polylepis.2
MDQLEQKFSVVIGRVALAVGRCGHHDHVIPLRQRVHLLHIDLVALLDPLHFEFGVRDVPLAHEHLDHLLGVPGLRAVHDEHSDW